MPNYIGRSLRLVPKKKALTTTTLKPILSIVTYLTTNSYFSLVKYAPGLIRTGDPLLRRQLLYPTELREPVIFEKVAFLSITQADEST